MNFFEIILTLFGVILSTYVVMWGALVFPLIVKKSIEQSILPPFMKKQIKLLLPIYEYFQPILLIILMGYLGWKLFLEIERYAELGVFFWPVAILLVMIFPVNLLSLLVSAGRFFDVEMPRIFNLLSTRHTEIVFLFSFILCSAAGAYPNYFYLTESEFGIEMSVRETVFVSFVLCIMVASFWILVIVANFAYTAKLRNRFRKETKESKNSQSFLEHDESLYLEFKSTFQTPADGMPTPKVIDGQRVYELGFHKFKSEKEIQKHLQTQSLKSICGFLNGRGGDLIIGVQELEDRGKSIFDVRRELGFKDADQFERHVQQQIKDRVGLRFASEYIETEYIEIENKLCLKLGISKYIPDKNQIPALLDDKDLYVRSGARTDPIPPGKEFAEFVSMRQSQSSDLPKNSPSLVNHIFGLFAK
ncbi:MAG: helix-turn-helix domain-containing protein [Candidatus Micropelagos sp.]